MIKRVGLIIMAAVLIFPMALNSAYADDAEVLPKGVSRVSIDTKFYLPIDERYNPDGDAEDVAADYNTSIDSSIFPLSRLEDFFGMPAGSARLGDSIVSFEYEFTDVNLAFMHGMTDSLTVGVIVPYLQRKNKVNATLDTSLATVGKSVIGVGFGAPLVPKTGTGDGGPFGDAEYLDDEDIQALLGNGLDVNGDGIVDAGIDTNGDGIPDTGYRYERVETWSGSGIGDMEAGFRYQYLKTDDWRLAFTGGLRLPTGKTDDPDNLVDFGMGGGTYDILMRFNNDYTGIRNMIIDGTVKYDLVLPDEQTRRIPDDVNHPLTVNKEEVKRDLGDGFELELSGRYSLLEGLSVSLIYNYASKLKDEISGNQGYAYESLEDETDSMRQFYMAGLAYSTLPLYMKKSFPIPLGIAISYRNVFDGSNNTLKSQSIVGGVSAFF